MKFTRSSGVLLHPTSLPSPYGIGDFGDSAYEFVDFLVQSNQSLWQILPLGPTGYGDSPYQCFSAFAGNPLLISPDHLVRDGYLPADAVQNAPSFARERVDYGDVIPYKNELYAQAYAHFVENETAVSQTAFAEFCDQQAAWLDDFALFMALKVEHQAHNGGVWSSWPLELAQRDPKAMAEWSAKLADDINRHKFLQFIFFQQWEAIKKYANDNQIQIVGDAPIFVAYDSADVWANPDQFFLDEMGQPTVIAGVPPDYFSETGQRWGNPLYDWKVMKQDDYAWWASRLSMIFEQVDIVRLDHFRGFEAYWEIPASEETAVVGKWVAGPGSDFFRAMQKQLGNLPIIAEDLGVITPGVTAMRDEFAFPGMKILQFGFGGDKTNAFLPHTYDHDCVVYTGTHDNDTTIGWYQSASPAEQDFVRRYAARDGNDIAWDMIRLAMASVAETAGTPMQDLMQLDTTARMNYPGRASGYWQWRFLPEQLVPSIATRLAEMTLLYGRVVQKD